MLPRHLRASTRLSQPRSKPQQHSVDCKLEGSTALRHSGYVYISPCPTSRVGDRSASRPLHVSSRGCRPLPHLERAAPSGHNHRTIRPTSTTARRLSFDENSQTPASETIPAAQLHFAPGLSLVGAAILELTVHEASWSASHWQFARAEGPVGEGEWYHLTCAPASETALPFLASLPSCVCIHALVLLSSLLLLLSLLQHGFRPLRRLRRWAGAGENRRACCRSTQAA